MVIGNRRGEPGWLGLLPAHQCYRNGFYQKEDFTPFPALCHQVKNYTGKFVRALV